MDNQNEYIAVDLDGYRWRNDDGVNLCIQNIGLDWK